jgi:hypothetical protein
MMSELVAVSGNFAHQYTKPQGTVRTVPKAKMLFTDVEQFKSFWVNGLPKCFSLRADTRAIINEKRGVRRNLFKINDLIRFTQTGLRQSLTSLV